MRPALVFVERIWYNWISTGNRALTRPGSGGGKKEVYEVYPQLTRKLEPRAGLYFVVLLAFAAATALLGWRGPAELRTLAAVELLAAGVLALAYAASGVRRRKEAAQYVKQLMDSMDQATRDSSTPHCLHSQPP